MKQHIIKPKVPKLIIGLGNPGSHFEHTRHNIGFKIVDQLAQDYGGTWKEKHNYLVSEININNKPVILVKPLTFMNSSGNIMSYFNKHGINSEEILVVHDELEMPFAKLAFKIGGSARGHNGLKSLMQSIKGDFARLRFGIDRPDDKSDVPNYVLSRFNESKDSIHSGINNAVSNIENLFNETLDK